MNARTIKELKTRLENAGIPIVDFDIVYTPPRSEIISSARALSQVVSNKIGDELTKRGFSKSSPSTDELRISFSEKSVFPDTLSMELKIPLTFARRSINLIMRDDSTSNLCGLTINNSGKIREPYMVPEKIMSKIEDILKQLRKEGD